MIAITGRRNWSSEHLKKLNSMKVVMQVSENIRGNRNLRDILVRTSNPLFFLVLIETGWNQNY